MTDTVLPAACRPKLRRLFTLSSANGDLVFSTPVKEITVAGAGVPEVVAAVRALDGQTTLTDVADRNGLATDDLVQVATVLYQSGLVSDETPVNLPSMLVFAHAIASINVWWGESRLRTLMASPKVDSRLALLYLVSDWHFVRVNPSHLGAVTSIAPQETIHMWAEFAAEEQKHGSWLFEGLSHAFEPALLRKAAPQPQDLAYARQYQWYARTDELAFAAMLGAGETGADATPGLADEGTILKRWVEQRVLPSAVIDPYLRHASTDAEADHLEVIKLPFKTRQSVGFGQRQNIMAAMWQLAQVSMIRDDSIYSFWQNPKNGWLSVGHDCDPVLETPAILK